MCSSTVITGVCDGHTDSTTYVNGSQKLYEAWVLVNTVSV